jgi:CBS domain-containing protein
MQISDVLRVKGTGVFSVQEHDTIESVVKLLAERHVGAVVVNDRWGKLAGIFSERDLVRALASRGTAVLSVHVSELMTRHVVTCGPADKIDAALAQMTLKRIRHLPVIDHDRVAGIVSIGDLVHNRLGEKELEAGVLLDITRMRH